MLRSGKVSTETGGKVSTETGGKVSTETGGKVSTETSGKVSAETGGKVSAEIYNFESSKKYYQQAIAKAGGDIRAISSMRINALYAVRALNRHDWEEELGEILGD